MFQIKRDPYLLAAFTVLAIGLGLLCAFKVITWPQLLVGLGVLTTPSIFGKKDDDDNKTDPPAGARGGTLPTLMTPIMVLAIALAACTPALTPRETARGTVLVLADAVKQLDAACAQMATAKHDRELATKCADGYDVARPLLLAAEAAVDAYDSGGAGNLPCAVAKAAGAVQGIAEAVTAAGGKAPPVVDDALRLAPLLAGACRG